MTMIQANMTEREKQFLIIAKKQEVSMTRSTERIIEFIEKDKLKAINFVKAIKNISEKTKIIELIASNQVTDVRGNDVSDSKALYLIDDDYYKKQLGIDTNKQISMF